MTGPKSTRSKDLWTAALTAVFLATLAVVYLLDEPTLWLAWAVLTVVASGTVMVLFNRATPQEP
ncbi:hypothetical protein [Natronococcus occultus]|uniref:Uncharacterized protein n=1 Tax=Natronococcus occultus SP4 TaxID=694430 RepID=L0K3C7_9EURY|nr:hypothetical protein [Natronococcus occultus]AGB38618.1 hypothetical protein Natoc_2860 [Natronococcus occultus SP4]